MHRTLPLAAAGLFAALGALELAHPQAQPFASGLDRLIEVVFILALVAAAAALAPRSRVAAAGHAALAVAAVATLAAGQDALGPVFLLGLLASVAGLGHLAVRRDRAGVVLLLALVGSFVAGAGAGGLVLAAGWAACARLAAPAAAPHAAFARA